MAMKPGDGEEKKRYQIPTYVYNPYHINLWAGDYLNKRQKYFPAIKQYNAAENNANADREMVPIYEERSIAYLHTWNLKATERDVQEGLQLRPNNAELMLTLGDLYYQNNQFGDALGAYYRGHIKKPRPPKFIHGIWASTGTIMNSLGSKVGNIMSKKRLGDVVVKMKLKELGHVVEGGQSEIARRRKIKKVKRIKDAYNEIYLNRAAKDNDLLQSCLNDRSLFLGNKKQNVLLRKTLEDALEKLHAAKIALWRRIPLYTREQDVLSKRVKLFNANKQDSKKADLEIVVNLRIAALDHAFHQDNHAECFKIGDQLRSFLFLQSERDLPSKNDSMVTVISILGDMFLKNKSLLPTTGNENDERLMVLFGFQKPQKLTHELFSEKGFHPKIPKLRQFVEAKLADLKHTTVPIEKAYLCHEIGVAYCFKGVPFVTRKYAREAIFASKAAKDRKWLLNSMFLLARSEIQQGNMNQGRVSLNGLMAAAEKFNYPNLKYMAIRAYELTGLKSFPTASNAYGEFENKIIKAMSNHEYTITAIKYLQKARTTPRDRRFPSSRNADSDVTEGRTNLEEEQTYYQALYEAKRRATLEVEEEQF